MMGTHNFWTRRFSPQESLLWKYFGLCTHYIHVATLRGEPYCFITVQSSTLHYITVRESNLQGQRVTETDRKKNTPSYVIKLVILHIFLNMNK